MRLRRAISTLGAALGGALAGGACARQVPVESRADPIAADRLAPAESIVVVLPDRCAGERATHVFHGAIATLDASVRVDSARMVALLARLTEPLALPVRLMHAPVLGEVVLTLGRGGEVRRYEARALREEAAFTRAISRALEVMRFPGALDALGVEGDSLVVFLTYETGTTLPFGYARSFRAAPPSERAAVRAGTAVSPRYPIELWQSGVEGSASALFLVDSAGGVAPGSVLVSASDEAFARAVLDAFPRYAFTPMRVGACRIASLFELPFQFRLRE